MHFAKLAAGLALLSSSTLPAVAGGPSAVAAEPAVTVAAEAPKAADPWTGPWAAVTLGSGRTTYDISGTASGFGIPGPVASVDLPEFGGKGSLAGLDIGYNKRFDNLVLGVELGRTASHIDTDAALNLGIFLPIDLTYRYRASSTTSILGRIGYLVNDKSMIFGLAGVTHAKFDGSLSTTFGPSTDYGLSLDGLTVGAGIETMVTDKISVRLDYRVTTFQDRSLFDGIIGPVAAEAGLESSMQTVNASVVMRF